MTWQIRQLLNNEYFPYGFFHLVVPVVAAVVLYRYLHSPGSVTMVHGLPLTRAKIFNSNFLSGAILIVLPLIAITSLLLLLAKPTFDYGSTVDLFTTTLVLQWLWQSLIVVLSVYGIGVFAGVVSGNTALHMLLGFGFNGLLPALYSVSVAYFNEFLFGFDGVSRWVSLATGIMPFTKAIESQGPFSLGLTIYYVLFFIGVLLVSSLLYHKRHFEKAGDSLVFKSAGIVICYLIAFFGMSLMAFYFNTIPLVEDLDAEGHGMFYLGLLVGIVIFLYIGRMIVTKTPRVFNKESLKYLVIYTVIALVFVATVDFDFTSFEKRVPSPSKVDRVGISGLEFSDEYLRYNPVFFKGSEYSDSKIEEFVFSDEKNISALTDFHQEILNKRMDLESGNHWNNQGLAISYDRKGLFDLSRRYIVPRNILGESKDLKEIYESQEFKSNYSFKALAVSQPTWIRAYNELLRNNTVDAYGMKTINSDNEIKSLMTSMEEDFQARTWEEHIDNRGHLATLELAFSGLTKENAYKYNYHYSEYYPADEKGNELRIMPIKVRNSDSNTIAWLKDNGYYDELTIKVEDISYITVYHETPMDYDYMEGEMPADSYMYMEKYGYSTDEMVSSFPSLVIDKPEDIKILMDSYITSGINYDDSYYGVITFHGTAAFASSLYNYQDEYKGGDGEVGEIALGHTIYFDTDNLPQVIKAAFNQL